MTNRIHYISIKDILDEEAEVIYSGYLEFVFNEKDKALITTIESGKNEVFYTFLEEEKVRQMLSVFLDFDLLVTHRDITESVLMGVEESKEFKETFSDEKYRNLLEDYLRCNLSVDLVLDKINACGMKSLTPIDFQILNKNNQT